MIRKLFRAVCVIACAVIPIYGQDARYERGYIPWPAPMQFIDRILRPCASGATPYVSAIAASDGDLDLTTCAGRSVTINGTPITPGGGITGSGTTNTVTKWTGSTAIGNSRITDNGVITGVAATDDGLNDTVAFTLTAITTNGAGTFYANALFASGTSGQSGGFADAFVGRGLSNADNSFVTGGSFSVGGTTLTNSILYGVNVGIPLLPDASGANQVAGIHIASQAQKATTNYALRIEDQGLLAGDFAISVAGGLSELDRLQISGAFIKPTAAGGTDLGTTTEGFKQVFIDATITAGGTTGNQTINKSAGSVNFAAAATSLVVTSNKVTTNSVVICTVGTNDTTLKSVQCVAAAGSFTMFANAAATAETRVNFWILNQ